MNEAFKKMARVVLRRFGYAGVDLRKDVGTGLLLPGHVSNLLKQMEINCVIDVGANRGLYAAMLRHYGYKGRIVSIEPLPEVYEELTRVASSAQDWRTLNVALGASEMVKPFNVYSSRVLSSFLTPVNNIGEILADSEVVAVRDVHMTTLDRIFPEITKGIAAPRVFLKLDTQGYDLEVVRGATQSLASIVAMQSEISIFPLYEGMPDYATALTRLREVGYLPTGFFSVVGHRTTSRTIEFDVVLVRDQLAAV